MCSFVERKNFVLPPKLDRKVGTCKYNMTDSSALQRRQEGKLVNVVLARYFVNQQFMAQGEAGPECQVGEMFIILSH